MSISPVVRPISPLRQRMLEDMAVRGLRARRCHASNIARARELLAVAPPPKPISDDPADPLPPCPCCGGRMRIIEAFGRWGQPRAPPHSPAPTGVSAA